MTYKQDKKKIKEIFVLATKKTVTESKGFVRFSYFLTIAIRILAVIVGACSACKTMLSNPYWFEYIMPVFYLGAIWGMSFASSAVYKGWSRGMLVSDYSIPLSATEYTLTKDGDGYVYTLEGDDLRYDGADTSRYVFKKADITKAEYHEDVGILTLIGDIKEERCKGDMIIQTNTWARLSIMDAFMDFDLRKEFCSN